MPQPHTKPHTQTRPRTRGMPLWPWPPAALAAGLLTGPASVALAMWISGLLGWLPEFVSLLLILGPPAAGLGVIFYRDGVPLRVLLAVCYLLGFFGSFPIMVFWAFSGPS